MSSPAHKAIEEQPAPTREDDRVWAALMRAPIGPPDTDEEREIIEAARAREERIPGTASSAADAEWLNGFPGFAEEYIAKHPGAFELGARRATLSAMATRSDPLSHDPVLEALARAPIGEPLTPEQRAELDQDLADIAAGRARLVRHEDMPSILEELARGQSE